MGIAIYAPPIPEEKKSIGIPREGEKGRLEKLAEKFKQKQSFEGKADRYITEVDFPKI